MSVINQMLRDLDQRRQTPPEGGLHQGVHSVVLPPEPPARRAPARPSRWAVWAVVGLGAVALGAAAWYQGYDGAFPGGRAPAAGTVAVAPMVAALASAPVTTEAADASGATHTTVVPPQDAAMADPEWSMRLRLAGALAHVPPSAASPAPPAANVPPKPALVRVPAAPAPVPLAAVSASGVPTASAAKVDKAAAATMVAASMPDAVPPAPNPGAAAREALAQAQALWHNGNPSAATELLREAVSVALRVRPGGSGTAMDATLLSMVRELARMQMGAGQVAAAHDLLVQQEARFKGHADYWATRANAAQRLGQHADSVQSYMQALQSRPNEQRWLLGLAVSLAAMGQTSAATSMAEKARAEGPIPREIAEYLRQMGVVLR